MNETRRFIRYVIPGLVFAMHLVVLLWVLHPNLVKENIGKLNKDSGIALVFAGVLASGAVGILLSTIHHAWHWNPRSPFMDHSGVLERLIDRKILIIEGLNGRAISRECAWMILTALWHERLKSNDFIGSAEMKTQDMVDLMHSTGTNRVGVIAAALIAFASLLAVEFNELEVNWRWPFAAFLAVITFWIFHNSYVRLARFTQAVIDQVVFDALSAEKAKNAKYEPITCTMAVQIPEKRPLFSCCLEQFSKGNGVKSKPKKAR